MRTVMRARIRRIMISTKKTILHYKRTRIKA